MGDPDYIRYADYEYAVVTGVDAYGARYRRRYRSDDQGWRTAIGTVPRRGSLWGERKDGTRKLIRRY